MPANSPTYTRPAQFGGDPAVLTFLEYGLSIEGNDSLTSDQLAALNRFVVELKANGNWANCQAIYPIIGGTSSWHSINLKDPNTFSMLPSGEIIDNASGTQGNGDNGYWDTGYDWGLQTNGGFFSVYSRSNAGTDGIRDFGFDGSNMAFNIRDTSDNLSGVYNGSAVNGTTTDARGFYTLGVSADTFDLFAMKNGVSLGNDVATPFGGLTGSSVCWMCDFVQGIGPSAFSARQYSFFAIGNVFTPQLDTSLNASVQKLQAALGRQV